MQEIQISSFIPLYPSVASLKIFHDLQMIVYRRHCKKKNIFAFAL